MAGRIRTLKPEWLENERLAAAGSDARVLSIALVLLADDHGNGRASIGYLAGQVWHAESSRDPREVAEKALEALARIGYVALHCVEGQAYYSLPGWRRHQRVDKPGKPRVPGPDTPGASRVSRESRGDLAPDHDHDLDHDLDQDHESKVGPSASPRDSFTPEGAELADQLRAHLLAEKPDHALSQPARWSRQRPGWAKQMSALLKADRRQLGRAKELLAWVFGDQGGSEFRFRIESPKALRDKWDKVDLAMRTRRPRINGSHSPPPASGGDEDPLLAPLRRRSP